MIADKLILYILAIFQDSFSTFLSFIKIIFWSKAVKIPKSNTEECIILGNGPSLKAVLDSNINEFKYRDLICVNYFVKTDYFTLLKPSKLIMTDPFLWDQRIPQEKKEERAEFLEQLNKKVSWNLLFIVPVRAKKTREWKEIVNNNKFIKIVYFNGTPIEGFKFFERFAYKYQLGMPRPRNVLIPSIYISIIMKYKKIIILGADHNWLEEIYVNEENDVMVKHKHFYSKEIKPVVFLLNSKFKAKMHEILKEYYYVFFSYIKLRDFADYSKTEIINCTTNSFIDAFEKKSLSETLNL